MINKYNFDAIQQTNEEVEGLGGTALLTASMVSPNKPTKTEWFQVRNEKPITLFFLTLKDAEGKDNKFPIFSENKKFTEALTAAAGNSLEAELYHYQTSNKRHGIWPVTIPRSNKYTNRWLSTARDAVLTAQQDWVRIGIDQANSCYSIAIPQKEMDSFPKLDWDTHPYFEIVEKAFEGLIIDKDNYLEHSPLQNHLAGKNVDF